MWLLGVEVGFAGFIISLFGTVWKGFDRNGSPRRGVSLWFLSIALFFGLMCISLPRVPRPDKAVAAEAALRQIQNKEP